MPKVLSQEKQRQLRELMINAQQQLEQVGRILPENRTVIEQYPQASPIGYYSEIDMGFGERMKRCESTILFKDPLTQLEYKHLKDRIEANPVYQEMKDRMEMLSQKLRIVDRALRLCKDDDIKQALEEQKETIKKDPILQDYNILMNTFEAYSGVKLYQKNLGESSATARERFEITRFCYEKFGINTGADLAYSPFSRTGRVLAPKSLEIEFENLNDTMQALRAVSDKNLGKNWEEIQGQEVDRDAFENDSPMIPAYMQGSCDRVLNFVLPDVKDRADFILIDGVSVRERMRTEENIEDPTEEQIKRYSSLYVAAALRNGNYVETFMKEYGSKEGVQVNYNPVPIVAKGKDSFILKKKGNNELENLTIGFLDRILAKLGFTRYREKVEKIEAIQRGRESFRVAHTPGTEQEREIQKETTGIMKSALSKKSLEERKQAFKLLEKHKEDFLAFRESNMDFSVKQAVLDEQFFLGEKSDVINKATGIVVEANREKLRMFAIVKMLERGYSLEEILDPMKHTKLREEIGKEVREELTNCDAKTFFQKHADVTDTLLQTIEDYAKENNISFTNPESVFGKAGPLLELAVGAGNVPDIFSKTRYKSQIIEALGEETVNRIVDKTSGIIINGMAIDFRTKAVDFYRKLAEGKLPTAADFSKAIFAEVVMGVYSKLEKENGSVYSHPITLPEMNQLQEMVVAHPKVERFFKQTSPEKLVDLMVKGKILEELKVDFEILPQKMMPNREIKSPMFSVDINKGDSLESKYVPSFNGKTDFYKMEDPDMIMEEDDMEI